MRARACPRYYISADIIFITFCCVEESNPSLANFEENLGLEITKRNQSSNNHLDNRLLRLCHKLKYDSLLTNKKLFEWKVIDSALCKFCGVEIEDMEHLLNNCASLKPLWEIVEERTLTCWKVKLSQLDKYVGSRLDGNKEKKGGKTFSQDSLGSLGN